jgi:hypothetical protein
MASGIYMLRSPCNAAQSCRYQMLKIRNALVAGEVVRLSRKEKIFHKGWKQKKSNSLANMWEASENTNSQEESNVDSQPIRDSHGRHVKTLLRDRPGEVFAIRGRALKSDKGDTHVLHTDDFDQSEVLWAAKTLKRSLFAISIVTVLALLSVNSVQSHKKYVLARKDALYGVTLLEKNFFVEQRESGISPSFLKCWPKLAFGKDLSYKELVPEVELVPGAKDGVSTDERVENFYLNLTKNPKYADPLSIPVMFHMPDAGLSVDYLLENPEDVVELVYEIGHVLNRNSSIHFIDLFSPYDGGI